VNNTGRAAYKAHDDAKTYDNLTMTATTAGEHGKTCTSLYGRA